MLTWSMRRKILYAATTLVVLLLIALGVYIKFFTAAPTCFDGKKNGDETGVDCGGSCSLVCARDAHAPVVLWSRAFETGPGTYTAAAYIQNNNIGKGAHNVAYSFQLFDASNVLIAERDGVADLPPMQTIPIVESNIPVGNRTVARTLFAFSALPVWITPDLESIAFFHTSGETFGNGGTSLSAQVENASIVDAQNIIAIAVLFDKNGAAQAASKSLIPSLAHRASTSVYFTWPQRVPNVAQADITLIPSF